MQRHALLVTWWQWDEQAGCWRPTAIHAQTPLELDDRARLVPLKEGRRCALFSRAGVTVNGLRPLPVAVLEDRDEVALATARFCFSRLSPPKVVTVGAGEKAMRCARCLGRLQPGHQIVACPGCRAHHHAPCWAYDRCCQKCRRPTDAAFPASDQREAQ